MRKVAHGTVWFKPEDKEKVLNLMQAQCSAMRSAYQAKHKHELNLNSIRKYVKSNYMEPLNQRYVNDAVSRASKIKDNSAIFGGKRLWNRLQNGSVTVEQWRRIRNNQLYSRGDSSQNGNPNIRVNQEEGKLWINDPSEYGKWIEGSLHVPDKWGPNLECYNMRILLRKGKFQVRVMWEEEPPAEIATQGKGVIGVDTNPDGVALVEVSEKGNLLSHEYIKEQRLQFAGENKRNYDVRQLAKKVVSKAQEANKALVLERLDFKDGKNKNKKFNRMRSNFLHKKIIEAIQAKALKEGIPVRGINPAFTSILGKLKYKEMYSLSDHAAAALVIARRGLGLKERQDFTVTLSMDSGSNSCLNLEGRGHEHTLTRKAYSFLSGKFLKGKAIGLTAPSLVPSSKLGKCDSVGEVPTSESYSITGRVRKEVLDFFSGDERHPSRSA